ncbi:MAG TPA: M81 family metallopeptidase, partial [Kiloniellales bacterium]|nr:M81 family metallopeptidase [Kiloniellales bacterium]
SKATLADFLRAGGWPGLTRGEQLFEKTAGINLPITGFIDAAREAGHELEPLVWANATPSNVVTEEAYETIVAMLIEALSALRGLDAVYLDLHGAMVTEHLEDGEGELLRRVRTVVGRELPVVCSLDLHANVTPQMVELADGLVVFRTYPHVDMAASGKRAFVFLRDLLDGRRSHKAYRQVPFLIPLTAGCTLVEPAKGLYQRVESLEAGAPIAASFACGFSPADIRECGPSVLAYGPTAGAADAAADALYREALGREAAFGARIFEPDEAVAYARRRAAELKQPIVIADTQDNPGAGGDGNTVGLLEALVAGGARDAVFGLLIDAEGAALAHKLGEGARGRFKLGLPPYETEALVRRLGDGRFTCTGPFYEGARMELGPMALLDVGGVLVALASRKVQAADQEMFRCLGVEPVRHPVLALKSSVHFRAHFQPIAGEVIIAAAPGPNPVDHRKLAYKRLRKGMRLMPLGPAFAGASAGSG